MRVISAFVYPPNAFIALSFLLSFHKIGCGSAIKVNFIALTLHYLSDTLLLLISILLSTFTSELEEPHVDGSVFSLMAVGFFPIPFSLSAIA